MRLERLGELDARICGGSDGDGGGDGPVVVLMHGFGAPGTDLVGLAHVLPAPAGTRFVFPEAPLALDPMGARAWWMIDLAFFEERARGIVTDRTDERPPEMPAAREKVQSLLAALPGALGGTDQAPLVLGGFSQGSMLALDVALHLETPPSALALLSSTLIARSLWTPRMPKLAGVPVLQTHGTLDPVLPFDASEMLRDELAGAGAKVQFVQFTGGHEIPAAVLREFAAMLAQL